MTDVDDRGLGAEKVGFGNPGITDLVDRVEVHGRQVRVLRLVGRRFASVEDHAEHLREGGCAKIIEVLAAG